ncbi:MAG: D-2-hydroxyacid dehydrogenase [Oscillospiraceae bacterium]|nr:D-2-hydroxyacid dehydrogenase [Oscillospiraceae bacterium]
MKELCLIRTELTDNTIEKLCTILQSKYRVILRNDKDYKAHPFTDTELKNASIIIGNPSIHTLAKCENLKWLQIASSGADVYAGCGLLHPDKTVLTNATGAYGHAIAEYMVAGVFALYKKLHLYRDNQFSGLWDDLGCVKTIRGSRVLVVGLGDIGGQFAEKMHALGAEIHGIKRTPSSLPLYVKSINTLDKLDRLLPQMDIVALCLPNSSRTQNIISINQLELMKNDAVLINVGRGNAVDTDALAAALQKEIIGGALLDVTNPEPLPSYHPLWKAKNAIITPHISGGYHARETVEAIEAIMLENAQRYVDGKELMNQVDYDTGYRKSK